MTRGWETIHGVIPAKSNCYKVARNKQGRYYMAKGDEMRRYERDFVKQCKVYAGAGIGQEFELYLRVYYPDYVHDLDNSLKGVLDCLQYAGAVVDDRFCIKIVATRHHDKARPRIEYLINVPNYQTRLFEL